VSKSSPAPSKARHAAKLIYHAALNVPHRLLHGRRHRAGRLRLSRAPRPKNILVVCYGNVCRSPYLQAVLQRALPGTTVRSAGFFGSDRAVPELSIEIAGRRGIDLSHYRSRPLLPADVTGADLIIVMDAEQEREILDRFTITRARIMIAGDLDPNFASTRAIADPWNKPAHVFEESFDRLDRCAAALVSALPPAT